MFRRTLNLYINLTTRCFLQLTILGIRIYLGHHIQQDIHKYAHIRNFGLLTPKVYESYQLHKWHSRPIVRAENPIAPGEMGTAVTFASDEMDEVKTRFKEHQFNIMASERISLKRSLPDLRPLACANVQLPDELPDTSIVIIFHNEAWSTLMRTLWSICLRSPTELVREIILVDDASDKEHLGLRLEQELPKFPMTVHLLRQSSREGLIKARLRGAAAARGEVLTFLDAHVECSENWLEPLLARVALNRYTVPSPNIDIINDDDFHVLKSTGENYGGMSAQFGFQW